MYLGIDPAADGAAVLIDSEGEVIDVWSWKYRKRKKPVYQLTHTQCLDTMSYEGVSKHTCEVRDGGTIATRIALALDPQASFYIACEEAYVSRQNPSSGLRVAKFGGEIVGGLSAVCSYNVKSVAWVMASKWRWDTIRLPIGTKRDQCKAASLQMIPKLSPSIKPHLVAHGELDHITDALGVALWCKMMEGR